MYGLATEEENGSLSLVKAVSAGSRMIDRGIAFVDRARLDNWTGNISLRFYSTITTIATTVSVPACILQNVPFILVASEQ